MNANLCIWRAKKRCAHKDRVIIILEKLFLHSANLRPPLSLLAHPWSRSPIRFCHFNFFPIWICFSGATRSTAIWPCAAAALPFASFYFPIHVLSMDKNLFASFASHSVFLSQSSSSLEIFSLSFARSFVFFLPPSVRWHRFCACDCELLSVVTELASRCRGDALKITFSCFTKLQRQ